jgi:signal transduction histidine kinase
MWSPGRAKATEQAKEPATTRVLVVFENDPTLPAAIDFTEGLRASLAHGLTSKLEIYIEYLDIQRFPASATLSRRAADLSAKYRDMSIAVAIGAGPGAAAFLVDHRDEIAPGASLIFGGVRKQTLTAPGMPADIMGVTSHFDVTGTVQLARILQPDAKQLVVLSGSAEFDLRWQAAARRELSDLTGLDVEYLTGLTLDGFVDRVRQLPPNAILLILTVYEDAEGKQFVPREAAERLAAASGAPAYGVYATFIGAGIVGGRVEGFRSMGEDVGALAVEALSGKATAGKITLTTAKSVVDWKQMMRWGLDPDVLPKDVEVRNYQPTVWEKNRRGIAAAAAIILLQFATIAALITQYLHRRKADADLARERLELAHLSRISLLGELSGAFAHELNQPLTSILANAEVAVGLLAKEVTNKDELGEILRDIVDDDKRAASIIGQLRSLMIKGEARLEPLDINHAIGSTIALANSEMVARHTRVVFDDRQKVLKVRGNVAQLQQLVLNLLLNAADAMSKLPAAERRIEIKCRKTAGGLCEMVVSDRGPGLPSELKAQAFKPFVSTKEDGLGLGLAICRSIALAHGGTLQFDSGSQGGARIVLRLPSL